MASFRDFIADSVGWHRHGLSLISGCPSFSRNGNKLISRES